MKNIKLLVAGAGSVISSLVMLLSPASAFAATNACDSAGSTFQKAAATWGCVAADNQSGNLVIYTYDVNGDGKCVNLYTRQLNGGSSATWNYHSQNCSGTFAQVFILGGAGSISTAADVRIVRSDGAYFTTVYNVY